MRLRKAKTSYPSLNFALPIYAPMLYHFDTEGVIRWIRARSLRRVAVQFPEGLKRYAIELVRDLGEAVDCDFFLIGDPCYGACDFPTGFRDYADALIQFGHSPIPSLAREDMLFVEVPSLSDPSSLVQEALPLLKKRVGLIATTQHIHALGDLRKMLEAEGIKVEVGRGDNRIRHPGQILGCNVTAALAVSRMVDQFLYLGSGNFHPLAVAITTHLPVIVMDPLAREVRGIDELKERILRQRHTAITLASQATSFAVLGSYKPGQLRKETIEIVVNQLEKAEKEYVTIFMNNFDPDYLTQFDVEIYVCVACPRLAIDDYLRFRRPMITPPELEIALGLRKWEDYMFDQILEQNTEPASKHK